jgi:hypothetical protein
MTSGVDLKALKPALVKPQPQNDAGFANPRFKELAKAIMRSQKILKQPNMGEKCEGRRE